MTEHVLTSIAPTLLTLEQRVALIAQAHEGLTSQIRDIKALVAAILQKLKL